MNGMIQSSSQNRYHQGYLFWDKEKAMNKIQIKQTGLSITPISFGAAPLGNMPDTYGHEVSEAQALTALSDVFASPVNFLDTANN